MDKSCAYLGVVGGAHISIAVLSENNSSLLCLNHHCLHQTFCISLILYIQYLTRKAKLGDEQVIKQWYCMKPGLMNSPNYDWITVSIVNDYSCCLVCNADNPCYVNLMWIDNDEIVIDLWRAALKWTRHFTQEETVPGNLIGIIEIIACEVLGCQRTVVRACLE